MGFANHPEHLSAQNPAFVLRFERLHKLWLFLEPQRLVSVYQIVFQFEFQWACHGNPNQEHTLRRSRQNPWL